MGSLQFNISACLVAFVTLGASCAQAATIARDDPLKPFELKEVLNGSFSQKGLGAVWVTDDRLASLTSDGIQIYDIEDDETRLLVDITELEKDGRLVNSGSWVLSGDLGKLLWSYDVQAGFRHSTEAKYSVYNIGDNEWKDLHDQKHLQTALLTPDGNSVAYVYENNVFYEKDIWDDGKEVTTDGSDDIYNGVPDWVYEEEVLSSGSALWFSPEGTYLAYAKFDDSKVQKFQYMTYGEDQYTEVVTLNYPKPGTANPDVQICVQEIDVEDLNTPSCFEFTDQFEEPILQYVAWAGDEKFLVVWLNRIQNVVSIMSYTLQTDKSWLRKEEIRKEEPTGWIQVSTPRTVSDTAWTLLLSQTLDGEDTGYLRPMIFKDDDRFAAVKDKITATTIYGWDTTRNVIFYQAAPEGAPGERHVYSVDDTGLSDVKCLSCDFKQPDDNGDCRYAAASFSRDFSYAAIACSGPGPAAVGFVKVEDDGSTTWLHFHETNDDLREKLSERLLPSVEATTLELEEGFTAYVRLWLPPGLDKSKKYPMLVFVYGGPGSQQVSEAFSVSWGYYLTTAKNIIYASIDGRGSGYQGDKNLFALYEKLGTVEVEDQISAARQLVANYPYIDPDRVGIWGWSYGGYATAMALALDTDDVFACGASVAPVTSWDLYDSIYTERYMKTPDENKDGYENANINKKIENFKTHEFYMLHGNADDNVHYQQSMHLARALEENDVFFEQQSYPDENHSIRSVVTHVYMSLGVFFDRCFEKEESEEVISSTIKDVTTTNVVDVTTSTTEDVTTSTQEVTTSSAVYMLSSLVAALVFPLVSFLLL